jgi:hypothetical protein
MRAATLRNYDSEFSCRMGSSPKPGEPLEDGSKSWVDLYTEPSGEGIEEEATGA